MTHTIIGIFLPNYCQLTEGAEMNAYETVRESAKVAGISTNSIGRALGKTSSYVASGATRGSTPKADTLAAMLNVCGYKLAAIPESDVPGSALVIDPPDNSL